IDEVVDAVRYVLRVLRRARRQQARETERLEKHQADVINPPYALCWDQAQTISREEHGIGATGQGHLCCELRIGGIAWRGNDLAEHGLAAHTRTRWHGPAHSDEFRVPKGELINAGSRQRDRLLDSSRGESYDSCIVNSGVCGAVHKRAAAENPWRADRA